jgi:peroxiredoxin
MSDTHRLQAGALAPDFDVTDVHGRAVRLHAHRGRALLLSFYRFSSCPFCNLRVHRLLQHREGFEARGLSMVAVFQSSQAHILEHVGQQDDALPIIADPERTLYAAYGIEASSKAIARAAIVRLGDAALALSKGFVPKDVDGDTKTIPADFVIDAEGIIRIAYYGRDIGDHLPIDRLESFLAASRHAPLRP